jgi:predicted dehydrogenase
VTSDDFASFHVRFSNGALGVITLSAVASVDEPTTITLHGENGGLRLRDGALFSAMSGGSWETEVEQDIGSTGDSPGGAFGTATVYLGRAIRAALDDGDRSALSHGATFTDGLRQQQVLDAARRSHHSGGEWVTVGSVQDTRQNAPAGF